MHLFNKIISGQTCKHVCIATPTIFCHELTVHNTIGFFQFDQSDLMLPNADYYMLGFNHPIIKTYYNILVEVALLLGADKEVALKDMHDLIEFEMHLANVSNSFFIDELLQGICHFFAFTFSTSYSIQISNMLSMDGVVNWKVCSCH